MINDMIEYTLINFFIQNQSFHDFDLSCPQTKDFIRTRYFLVNLKRHLDVTCSRLRK